MSIPNNASLITSPLFIEFDTSGRPLAGGKLYTYAAGGSIPLATYTDATLTVTNPNPVVLDNLGKAQIWFGSQAYKLNLLDANNVQQPDYPIDNIILNTQASLALALSSSTTNAQGQGLVGFNPALTYAAGTLPAALASTAAGQGDALVAVEATGGVPRTQHQKNSDSVSVLDFGADPTGATDSSSAFLIASLLGKRLYAPAGTYALNWVSTIPVILFGDGSGSTFITPFSTLTASITLRYKGNWTYGNVISDICFKDASLGTGVGITCGKTAPWNFAPLSGGDAYATGDEYIEGATFRNCRFLNLKKGVQAPFGNLGSSFYECGWTGCKYGCYFLDNKNIPANGGSGTLMHAGNKYFFGGEFDTCVCAVYIDNATIGMGAIEFFGTIIEDNKIAIRLNSVGTPSVPIKFDGLWLEANGTGSPALGGYSLGSGAVSFALDTWTGNVLSTTGTTTLSLLVSGSQMTVSFNDCAVMGDAYFPATESLIAFNRCQTEGTSGTGGGPITGIVGSTQVVCRDCFHVGAPMVGAGISFLDPPVDSTDSLTSSGGSAAACRWWIAHKRRIASGADGVVPVNAALPGPVGINAAYYALPGAGSVTPAPSIVVDGVLWPTCNQVSIPFTGSNQFCHTYANSCTTPATAGWLVAMVDIKIISGTIPTFLIWDGSGNQLASAINLPSLGTWYTVAAMGRVPAAAVNYYLDCQSNANGTVVVNYSGMQFRWFATKEQALNFLRQGVYVDPAYVGASVASASSIQPTGPTFHVTGTAAIATILPLWQTVTLIPDAVFSTTNGGNIAIASTAVVGKQMVMTYDTGTSKWYPSY